MLAGEEGVHRLYPSGRTVISLELWCMSSVTLSDSGMSTRDPTETIMSVLYGTTFSQVGKKQSNIAHICLK